MFFRQLRINSASSPARWPLPALAALLILLLAAALLWAAAGPAGAQDGYQPDQQVVDDVWNYARETDNGFTHVLRWMRVLHTFGELEDMAAAEARENASQFWAARWDPVVAELANLEAQDDYEPDTLVVDDVWDYARETDNGFDHVLRWMRVLSTLGAIEDMTATEARDYADQFLAARWNPVADELAALEAAAAANEAPTRSRQRSVLNHAPVADTNAEYYSWFTGDNNAPRGVLVSKPFHGIFSDPDGDDLSYAVAITQGRTDLVELLLIPPDGQSDSRTAQSSYPIPNITRVWFRADAEGWKSLTSSLPNPQVTTVTLTATDPGGLSASVSGDFLIRWGLYPEVVSARADGAAIELTFDLAVEANPAPKPGQFTVNVVNEGGATGTIAVSRVSVNGKVVTLDLASALDGSQTVTLDYSYNYLDDTRLQRAGGGDAAPGFREQAVEILQPPGQPQNLAVTATPGSLDISTTWDALDGATSYKLRWRLSAGEFEAGNAATVADTSATITVSGYGEWEVRLQGCNDAGCGPEAVSQFTVEPQSAAQGYRGQLAEVLVELSLRRPAQAGWQTRRGVLSDDGPTIQSSHTTSIVYVIDDSGSMDGDFPEVHTALEAVRDEAMADTKVALIAFGSEATTKFGLTDHSSAPWNTHINTFIGKLGGTKYEAPLQSAKALLDADTATTTKKIIFLTDAQEPRPSVVQDIMDANNANGASDVDITVDTIGFGDHFSDNFSVIQKIASETSGAHRAITKPSQGTTNTPAVTATAMSDILTGKVADNTATLFLVDHSFSVYRGNEAVLHPALTAAAAKAGEGTGRQAGLAIFLGETALFAKPPDGYTANHFQKYQVVNAIGSTSLSMDDATFAHTGSTDIDHALQQAYSTIADSSVTATSKRVVLITDGISAVGVQDSTLKKYKDDSATTLDVVAWGQHAKRVELKGWADSAGGTFSVAKAGPPMPSGFSYIPGDGAIYLYWNDPSDSAITKYQARAWRDMLGWSQWGDIPGSGASTTWHIVGVTTNDYWYTVQLRAVRGDTPGVPSAPLDIRAESFNIGLTATAGNGEIALSWNDPGDSTITKYQYTQRSEDGGWAAWTDISGSGATTTSHTVTGLTNGTEYTIAVRAVKGTDSDGMNVYGPVSAVTATPSN